MIKTLHITSIVIGIAAAVLIVFSSMLGSRDSEDVQAALKSASAIEEFKASKGKPDSRRDSRSSPLVEQAKAFALYLNPPPKPKPEPPRRPDRTGSEKRNVTRKPTGPVSAKFKLIGTAYYPTRPNDSMALIDQPGAGLSWVKQGESVQHLLFEQINDGFVMIRDGKNINKITTPARDEDQTVQQLTASYLDAFKATDSRTTSNYTPASRESDISPEEKKIIDEIFSEVETALMRGDSKHSDDEALDELISSLSKTRMDEDETERISKLGEALENIRVSSPDEPDSEQNFEPNSEPNSEKTRRSIRPGGR